ncbi:MAG: hypothetical protein H7Z19_02035, partial [Chitinophagaceae bacterium]|nr:hypothetical protein [Rubrivivax sp.]
QAAYREILKWEGKLKWEGDESIDWTLPEAADDAPAAAAAARGTARRTSSATSALVAREPAPPTYAKPRRARR